MRESRACCSSSRSPPRSRRFCCSGRCSTTPAATSPAPAPTTGSSSEGFLELLLIVANVGTALALFPVLKWQNESLALGYVAARIVECIFIAVGLVAVLAV